MEDSNERAVIGGNNPPENVLDDKFASIIAELVEVADQTTETVDKLRKGEGQSASINSDEDVALVAPLASKARDLFKRLDEDRAAEKKPHWDAGKAVDEFFKPHKARAERIFNTLEDLASDFQNRKIAAQRAAARAEADRQEKEAARLREEADKAKRTETAERKIAQAEGAELKADAAADDANASNAELGAVRGGDGGVLASARTVWDYTIVDYEKIPLDKLRIFLSRSDVEKAIKKFANHHKDAATLDGVTFTEKAKTSFR